MAFIAYKYEQDLKDQTQYDILNCKLKLAEYSLGNHLVAEITQNYFAKIWKIEN